MNILLYDTLISAQVPEDWALIDARKKATFCKGCFGCWLKTPARCVMSDRLETVGSQLLQAERLTIVSKCCYGGFSPAVKKILDRCIPGVTPFFVTKRSNHGTKEQHHAPRYTNRMKLTVWFYGALDEEEKRIARELVCANGLNYWAEEIDVSFVDNPAEVSL